MADTVARLLAERIAADPARPLVTVISDEGRVELSAVTVGSWVAKTAGLLRDDLFLSDGALVDIAVPLGWQAIAWQHAIWRAGLVVGLDTSAPDLLVRDEHVNPPPTGDVVVVGRHPLGMPINPAPTNALDWSLAARPMPDHFGGPFAPTSAKALQRATDVIDHAGLLTFTRDLAARWAVGSAARLLIDGAHPPVDAWLGAALVPVVTSGSVVLWTASRAPTGADLQSEGVTSVAR